MSFTCEHITKVYGGREVLKDVSLTLEPGKIYGLIGRNGAGKTTLLSILTAQNPATKGTVSVDGEPVWENRKALEKLCFSRELNVGAESGIAAIKVKEYLRIAATYYADWDKDMEQRLMALFELDGKKKLGKLSKGMLSMVTIIVAMCSKAPYTLLDEPVAGLDVVAREQFYKLLLDDYLEKQRTVIIATHLIEEVANLVEQVTIVDRGRVLLASSAEELRASGYSVSGRTADVAAYCAGMEVLDVEELGGLSVAYVQGKPDAARLNERLDVAPLNLQKLFVKLTEKED